MSDFLERIEINSRKSLIQFENISQKSEEIASNSEKIASEIPYWIKFEDIAIAGGVGFFRTNLKFVNESNFPIRDIELFIYDEASNPIWEINGIISPPREDVFVDAESTAYPSIICVTGISGKDGVRISEARQLLNEKGGTAERLYSLTSKYKVAIGEFEKNQFCNNF